MVLTVSAVIGIPTLKNSVKERLSPCLSACSKTMELLAAPSKVRLPARVFPLASRVGDESTRTS